MRSLLYPTVSSLKALLLLFFIVLSTGLYAQASLSIQGVLTKGDGTAVDDGNDYVLTFRLWKNGSSSAAADKVYQETISNITIVGGVYSVVLGTNGTPLDAPFDQIYYLGVSVGTSNSELLPRPLLTHAPYALSLLGQNNTFPSVGAVQADAVNVVGAVSAAAMKANGGAPTGGVTNNGFSFKNGGDADGGLFSTGDNNVGLYANATKALEASNGGVLIPGTLQVNGPTSVNNSLTVNGNQTVSGGVSTGAGYSFINDGGTGFFPNGGGQFFLKTNGVNRLWCNTDLNIDNNNLVNIKGAAVNLTGTLNLNSRIFAPGMLVSGNGGLGVFYDQNSKELTAKTSSRRFKNNIQPFVDNFELILQAQPKIYNRPGSPDPTASEVGYIAEEMDSLGLQELVIYDQNGQEFSLKYDMVPIYELEVLKIQHQAIQQLRTELEALKAENTVLKTVNSGLQTDKGALQKQQAIFTAQLDALSKRMNALEAAGTGK